MSWTGDPARGAGHGLAHSDILGGDAVGAFLEAPCGRGVGVMG